MRDPKFVIEQVTDPAEIARHRTQHERAGRNSDWLQSHWADLLPQARGGSSPWPGRKHSSPTPQRKPGPGRRRRIRRTTERCASTSSHTRGRDSMVIVGEWRRCDDGVARPAVPGLVGGATGVQLAEYFLVDSCADRSVLSAEVLNRLAVSSSAPPADPIFQGIGGSSEFVLVDIVLEFTIQDGPPAESAAGSPPLRTPPPPT